MGPLSLFGSCGITTDISGGLKYFVESNPLMLLLALLLLALQLLALLLLALLLQLPDDSISFCFSLRICSIF
jgi:hypothetical protein